MHVLLSCALLSYPCAPFNFLVSPTDADRDALVVTDLEESSSNQHEKNVQDTDISSESDGSYDTDLEEDFQGKLKEI